MRPAASAAATGLVRAAPALALMLVRAARALALMLFALVALPALAHDYTVGSLKVAHPYARPTPPGARTGGVYFTVENDGKTPDQLVKVASPAAQSVELHTMTMDGNLMKMRPVKSLDIPPGTSVTLGVNGYHVMLVGLAHPLDVGDQVPLTLTFARAGPVQVFAYVEAASAGAPHKH